MINIEHHQPSAHPCTGPVTGTIESGGYRRTPPAFMLPTIPLALTLALHREPPVPPPAPDPDFLTLEDVARILQCSVDTVRRIPRDELPVFRGPGKRNIYMRDELRLYVRQRRAIPELDGAFIGEVLGDVVGFSLDDARGRSRRRITR